MLRRCDETAEAEAFYAYSPEQLGMLGDDIRHGKRSSWVIENDAVVKIDPDRVRSTDGNVFSSQKLSAVACAVRRGDKPMFGVGYGDVMLIDEDDLEEDERYFDDLYDRSSMRPLDKRDLGKLLFRVRDGNHRTFGALLGGETEVWMHLTTPQLRDVKEYRDYASKKKLNQLESASGKRHVRLMKLLDKALRNA